MNFVMALLTMKSLWLSGRASESRILRSEVQCLMGTHNFFSLSHACDIKQKNIFLYFFTQPSTYHLPYSTYKIKYVLILAVLLVQ